MILRIQLLSQKRRNAYSMNQNLIMKSIGNGLEKKVKLIGWFVAKKLFLRILKSLQTQQNVEPKIQKIRKLQLKKLESGKKDF